MNAAPSGLREQRLRALGIEPLRLRARGDVADPPVPSPVAAAEPPIVETATDPVRITRLALHADPAERSDPAIQRMYTALGEAVTKAGLQPVRVCDVADDPAAAVLVFGAVNVPDDVPASRVLHTDALVVLQTDRERKRLLWERLLALGRGAGGD